MKQHMVKKDVKICDTATLSKTQSICSQESEGGRLKKANRQTFRKDQPSADSIGVFIFLIKYQGFFSCFLEMKKN